MSLQYTYSLDNMEAVLPPLSPALRTRLVVQIVFSFATLLLAAILTILLSLQSFSGVASTAPLVLGTCSNAYFSSKYGDVNRSILIVFFTSIISIFLQIAICVLVFPPLLMRLRPALPRIVAGYLLSCLHSLAALVAFGKYLTFKEELAAMTNCTVFYSPSLIIVLLAFATADMLSSLLQFSATVAVVSQLSHELEEGEVYRIVSNLTNNTLENIEEPAKTMQHVQSNVMTEAKLIPNSSLVEKKDPDPNQSNEQLRRKPFESQDHRSRHEREIVIEKKPSSPIKPSYNRVNSISEQESFNSMMREEKIALRVTRGPILASSNMQEGENAYRTQGYLSYLRRMNNSQGQVQGQTEGGLIATIRGKYAR